MNIVNIASNVVNSALNIKDALVSRSENIGLFAHHWTIPDTSLVPRIFGAHNVSNSTKLSQCDDFSSALIF